MKKIAGYVCVAILCWGCAKVSIESKPIKVDVTMRIDVYQHVAQDVGSIEDEIFGAPANQLNSFFNGLITSAYAADVPAHVSAAIEGRKARAVEIDQYCRAGWVGENRNALLSLRNAPADIRAEAQEVIAAENADRKIIYTYTAEKNAAEYDKTAAIFFQDHWQRAPAGYWFEVCTDSGCSWQQK